MGALRTVMGYDDPRLPPLPLPHVSGVGDHNFAKAWQQSSGWCNSGPWLTRGGASESRGEAIPMLATSLSRFTVVHYV